MKENKEILDGGHWDFENYTQRMTTEQWKKILLNYSDEIVVKGNVRKLKGKNLGAGVYEISKIPLKK